MIHFSTRGILAVTLLVILSHFGNCNVTATAQDVVSEAATSEESLEYCDPRFLADSVATFKDIPIKCSEIIKRVIENQPTTDSYFLPDPSNEVETNVLLRTRLINIRGLERRLQKYIKTSSV